jgi:hypothetical protein
MGQRLLELCPDRHNPASTNLVRRLKYFRNVRREVGNAIGACTHHQDPKRQYFYVLLELKIAI